MTFFYYKIIIKINFRESILDMRTEVIHKGKNLDELKR